MRWDAAATVGDRRFHSHIMDSNDPYLHLSKFFFSPLLCPFSHFLRFGWILCCANRVCFMAILRGAVRRAAPPHTFIHRYPGVRLLNLGANHGLSAGACLNLLLIENVRWSLLCRSGKVRGWHFNCAYVIYGARRASLALLKTLLVVDGCQRRRDSWNGNFRRQATLCVCVWFFFR